MAVQQQLLSALAALQGIPESAPQLPQVPAQPSLSSQPSASPTDLFQGVGGVIQSVVGGTSAGQAGEPVKFTPLPVANYRAADTSRARNILASISPEELRWALSNCPGIRDLYERVLREVESFEQSTILAIGEEMRRGTTIEE